MDSEDSRKLLVLSAAALIVLGMIFLIFGTLVVSRIPAVYGLLVVPGIIAALGSLVAAFRIMQAMWSHASQKPSRQEPILSVSVDAEDAA